MLPIDRTLSIMLTFACNAKCKNCGTFSSPKDRNRLPMGLAIEAIDQATSIGFSNVVFTGGEATIEWDALLACIRSATNEGLATRLVTNGQWARDRHEATNSVQQLISAGLGEINFSTGHEHQRFVPLDNVIQGIEAAVEAHLRTVLMLELHDHSESANKHALRIINERLPRDLLKMYFTTIESPWMPLHPMHKARSPESTLISDLNVEARSGCDSILQTYVVQADGRIAACCGLGMRYIDELHSSGDRSNLCLSTAIAESEDDLFKHALRQIGPERILAWASSKNNNIAWQNLYSHRCQACIRIYSDEMVRETIRRNIAELVPMFIFGEFLDRLTTSRTSKEGMAPRA